MPDSPVGNRLPYLRWVSMAVSEISLKKSAFQYHWSPAGKRPSKALGQHPYSAPAVAGVGRCAGTGNEQLEAAGVELTRLDRQHVPALASRQPVAADELAQPVEVGVERLAGAGRGRVPPQRIDQPVPGHGLVRVQQQERQQGPLLRAPQPHRPTVDP
jgi:hypothetical protein